MKKIIWIYSLTGNKGETLFEALREDDFNRIISDQIEYLTAAYLVNSDKREEFVSYFLKHETNYDVVHEIDRLAGGIPVNEFFLSHALPGETEEMRAEQAVKIAYMDAEDGVLWNSTSADDDVETALEFGLIKYPPFSDGVGVYIAGGKNCIPADVANEIKQLCSQYSSSESRTKGNALEKKAVSDMIFVDGFYCNIHGGTTKFNKPIRKAEVILCPSCEYPICPECANAYSSDPKTESEARIYMESCDDVSGRAYCGQCGDYSVEFMLGFLKLIGCPIPIEYATSKGIPRENAEFKATAAIRELPDFLNIYDEVIVWWQTGKTGIKKIEHATGEIWALVDRYPDKWVVTILYPHER